MRSRARSADSLNISCFLREACTPSTPARRMGHIAGPMPYKPRGSAGWVVPHPSGFRRASVMWPFGSMAPFAAVALPSTTPGPCKALQRASNTTGAEGPARTHLATSALATQRDNVRVIGRQ